MPSFVYRGFIPIYVCLTHAESIQFPEFSKNLRVLGDHLPFLRFVASYVDHKEIFLPVQLFRHPESALYRINGEHVDKNVQELAIIRCSASHLKREENLLIKNVKNLTVNRFTPRTVLGSGELLRVKSPFTSLEDFSASLNRVKCFSGH